MEVIIRDEAEDAAALTAAVVANAIRVKPGLVLGLAAGRTMETVYRLLVSMHADGGVDFSRVITFNLDEYIGVPPSDNRSFHYYMHTQLFNHINIDIRRTHVPNGMADDIDAECVRYEKALHKLGGIDLLLLEIFGLCPLMCVDRVLKGERMYTKVITKLTYKVDVMNSVNIDPCDCGFVAEWKTVFHPFKGVLLKLCLVVIEHRNADTLGSFLSDMNKSSRW
jgi:glucosamine-6-phosphate deaminase